MANILVKHYQADTLEQAVAKAPLRSIAYVKSLSVLLMKEEDSTTEGIVRLFPSLVGQGMGRRVAQPAHGFLVGQPVYWTSLGWVLAQATAAESTLATHMVVAVPSSDAFEVASFGAWNLGGNPAGTYYLSDTAGALTTSAPAGVMLQKIAVGDGTSFHLTLGASTQKTIMQLVTELNEQTTLVAIPKGEAGGDLGGAYANPIVRQISGIGADLVAIPCDFQFPTSDWGAPDGGRGIGYGRIFVGGTEVKAWVAQSEAGDLYWTVNHWETSTSDASLKSTTGTRWNCIRFAWLAAFSSYAWIAGSGYETNFYYALHTAANYNSNGTLKNTAWAARAYTAGPGNVGDMSVHGSTICYVGNSPVLGYTNDFTTFTAKFTAGSVLGGVDTDQYGTWIAVERDTGILWKSINEGVTWAQVTAIFVDGAAASHLPTGVQWGAINSAYGLWVASVWDASGTTGHTSYAYSEDGVNWFSFADPSPTSFYTCAFDGVRWYATNANAQADPPVYQMLVDSVPVKRRLALEKGAAISGPVFLADLPDAAFLGTDQNGKVIGKSAGDILGEVDFITYDITPESVPSVVGTVSWNPDEGTLDIQQPYGVTLQAGQEVQIHIINKSGVAIPNGAPVYITGAQGNRPTVALAEADILSHANAIAIATMDIANNAEGFVTRVGLVRNLDTSAWTEGDALYLSDAPGVLTNVAPTSRKVRVAYVVRDHATVGSLFVSIESTANLDDLGDVDATAPTEGYYLKFVSGRWVPAAVSGGGGSALAKYAATMPPALATASQGYPNGGNSGTAEWTATGTMLVPDMDITLTNGVSKLAMIWSNQVNGKKVQFAIYAYPDAGGALTLVGYSTQFTMTSGSSYIDCLWSSATSTLTGGKRYFFVMFTNSNGGAAMGSFSSQNLNIQPYRGWVNYHASLSDGTFPQPPATITPEGEYGVVFFGRCLA